MTSDSQIDPAPRSSWLLIWLELMGLVGIALAQPIYDLIGHFPEFLVAHDLRVPELLVLGFALSFAIPLLLLLLEVVTALVTPKGADALHWLVVAISAGAVTLQLLSRIEGAASALVIGIACFAGLGAAFVVARFAPIRSFLRLIALAAVAFPLLFYFNTPVRELLDMSEDEIVSAQVIGRPAPVVVLVLDEFPVVSLLDEAGRINASQFPNLAALSRTSTWYPNTATAASYTTTAIPALLTGSYPDRYIFASTYDTFPHNLFSLLGSHYEIHNFEAITQLCPVQLCSEPDRPPPHHAVLGLVPDLGILYLHLLLPESMREDLPRVTQTWKNFTRGEASAKKPARGDHVKVHNRLLFKRSSESQSDFDAFLQEMGRNTRGKPILHFFHLMLPHPPWNLLPSGQRYYTPMNMNYGLRGTWSDDPWEPVQAYQRHMLQARFVDRMVGSLIARLQDLGIFEDTLLAVIADHGASFRPSAARRSISAVNAGELLLVPFFMKLPGQKQGTIDPRPVETVDLVPSLADALGIELPWPVDGRSILAPETNPRTTFTTVEPRGGSIPYAVAAVLADRDEALRYKLGIFGTGRRNAGLYAIGPAPEILGRRIGEIPRAPGFGRFRAQLYEWEHLQDVDLDAPIIPVHFSGQLSGADVGRGDLRLAIAVNGRIAAVTQSFETKKYGIQFMAMIPKKALRKGRNGVEFFRVLGAGEQLRLQAPIAARPRDRYQ